MSPQLDGASISAATSRSGTSPRVSSKLIGIPPDVHSTHA